jgi:hypothetical protein
MSESQIVSATNEQAAKAAWPTCQDQCNQCIPPAISVYCANGTCAGTLVELGTDASDGLMQDHCGVDGTSGSADTPMFFSCGSTPPGSGDGGKTDSGVANDSGKDSAAGKDSGGGDAGCTGDAATWASLTGTAVSCTKNSDCCVIVNDCTWEAQVVSAANETAAEAAWPTCQNECTHCMSPAVDVGCFNGTCGGRVVSLTSDGGLSLFGTHCGDDSVSTTGQSTGGSAFECNAKPTGSDGGA